ncbi:uncharacterized protein LOC131228658 [Magnolia sinica]|uniref:uncharacterized protein LOC131228658 n=1 Tax=Magnolia sinica TaxID=86752 RepID=UPI002657DB40|nr:uncharacterized protein LOC131228658 [Magnolia sinica]
MKNLYRKGKVHPSPSHVAPHQTDPILSLLCNLPSTILTLTAALLPEDRQVLAYLLNNNNNNYNNNNSNRKNNNNNNNKKKTPEEKRGEHPPLFDCSCFRCYMSFWVRWDSSPNRQLIHEILEAFEDSLQKAPKQKKQQQQKRKGRRGDADGSSSDVSGEILKDSCLDCEDHLEGVGIDEEEKSTVGRFVSFIGERIWGVWNQ